METVIGITFKDHVLVAASGTASFYYMKLTDSEDKLHEVDEYKIAAATGEQGDRVHLLDYLTANMKLNQMRSAGARHTTWATANFLRQHMAQRLRSREGIYRCNIMFAGYDVRMSEHDDSECGPKLYWMDYLASLKKVNFGAHGYGGSFVTGFLDKYWKADMSEEESINLMREAIKVVQARLIVDSGKFSVKLINKDGVRKIDI
eukprot:Sspe_Gene.64141::Locus_37548_Transcript_2_2_Confidence_0.750_Length_791::g.64141::m.64141/K02734/PSMB2; 20S proteasome subunit beta 4